jgi:hypothetical protein
MGELAERDERGLFRPGNSVGKKGGNPLCGRVMRLKRAMLDATDEDTVRKLMVGLLDIATTDASSKVRIQATMAYLAYAVGRPTEHVELDVATDGPPAANIQVSLDAHDLAALEQIRAKLTQPTIDVQAVVVKEMNG